MKPLDFSGIDLLRAAQAGNVPAPSITETMRCRSIRSNSVMSG